MQKVYNKVRWGGLGNVNDPQHSLRFELTQQGKSIGWIKSIVYKLIFKK